MPMARHAEPKGQRVEEALRGAPEFVPICSTLEDTLCPLSAHVIGEIALLHQFGNLDQIEIGVSQVDRTNRLRCAGSLNRAFDDGPADLLEMRDHVV